MGTDPSPPYFLPPSLNITLFCPTWNWSLLFARFINPVNSQIVLSAPPSHPTINSPPIFISANILLHFQNVPPSSSSSFPQRIENQINLYLKFNKQFDFEDDMQRTKANFAGCVFGNFQTLAGKKKHNLLINSNHAYCQQDYAFWQSFTLAGGNPNVPHQKSSEAWCSVLGKD